MRVPPRFRTDEGHSINYGNYMFDQKCGNVGNCLVFAVIHLFK